MPHRDIEIHVHPRDPRGRIRSFRFRRRAAVGAAALLSLFLVLLIAGLAALPRAVRVRLSERDYRAGVALRQELGDRLRALVDRLGELADRGRRLRERNERIAGIYGLVPLASDGAPDAPLASGAAAETIYVRRIAEGNRIEAELTRDLERVAFVLGRIEAHERLHPAAPGSIPVLAPIAGEDVVMASGFGPRRSPYTQQIEFHSGVDFAAARGTVVVAPADGTVVWTGVMPASPRHDWWRLGRAVVLRHGDSYRTIFGHLGEVRVAPGQRVLRGDLLGRVGDSGWTTAPNLHFEIRRREEGDWVAVEPRAFLLSLPGPPPEAQPPVAAREVDGARPQSLPAAFLR